MTPATLLLILLLFLVAIAVLLVVVKAMRSWVFELTPTQWTATFILTFSAGALLVAVIDGNGEVELLSGLPIGIAIVWVVASSVAGSRSRGRSSAEEG